MNTYMCNYNFIFILLYKYVDNNNIMQNSICTIIKIFILLFVYEYL